MQYFDQRREHARTDWDDEASPTGSGRICSSFRDAPTGQQGRLAALRLPASLGGRDGTNVDMAIIESIWRTKRLVCTTICRTIS